jgi:hypothetical protein
MNETVVIVEVEVFGEFAFNEQFVQIAKKGVPIEYVVVVL